MKVIAKRYLVKVCLCVTLILLTDNQKESKICLFVSF